MASSCLSESVPTPSSFNPDNSTRLINSTIPEGDSFRGVRESSPVSTVALVILGFYSIFGSCCSRKFRVVMKSMGSSKLF